MSTSWSLSASLMVVSDIHLHHCQDNKARTLLKILDHLARRPPECFVLLGDIFDFALGSNGYYRRKFAPIGKHLTRLANAGTRVIFFEGNHEFDLPRFRWEGVEFVKEGHFEVRLKDGTRILFTHGDMLFPSKVYARFRTFVKSMPVKTVASCFPGALLDKLTLKSAEISRAQDDARTIDHKGIISAAQDWLEASGCDHGIFGHYHIPYAEAARNGHGKILSLECWDTPNILYLEEQGFSRAYLGLNGSIVRQMAVKPLLDPHLNPLPEKH